MLPVRLKASKLVTVMNDSESLCHGQSYWDVCSQVHKGVERIKCVQRAKFISTEGVEVFRCCHVPERVLEIMSP